MKEHLEKIAGAVYDFEMMCDGLLVTAETKKPSDERAELFFIYQAFHLMQQELKRHSDTAYDTWTAMEKRQPKNGPTLVS
jgi:hypothetical protein